ncbi:rhomboid family intramembrane serine protease [Fluviicola sp.]|uniref:rhomboid family intramembrane serine protease n=1 Tax=Fluviicola sp. TaxID=1917219 RepID=UPI00260B420C|nr:rhomboid family intramembrane serine protease [Fluviicola sp.]
MNFKKALLFLLIPAFLSSGLALLISFLINWLLNKTDMEINQGILIGWIPFFLGCGVYFLIIHHRLKLFLSKRYDNNYLFSLLAIVFMTFPAVSFQIAYENMKMDQREIHDLSEIDFSAKNTVWKYTGPIPQATMTYLGDFQEYTSGKNPKVDFLSYALVNFEEEELWLLFSDSEMIDNEESDSEKGAIFNKVHENCMTEVNNTLNLWPGTRYLIPLEQSEDLEYAHKTLKDTDYKGSVPKRIFKLEASFQPGFKTEHQWLLGIAISLNVVYFLIFCLFRRNVSSYELSQTGVFDISGLDLLFQHVRKTPVTALLLTLTLVFFFVEIAHDPNIFTVKEEPSVFQWAISNTVWQTGEWYRLFTYPFVNIHLLLRLIDVMAFAVVAYSIEKNTSSAGFALLSFCILITGGLSAAFFSSSFNCGLTVFTCGYSAYYLFTGFQPRIGFSSWKFIGISFLVFGLIIVSLSGFFEYPKLIAATLTGFAFGPFLKYREVN